LIEIRLTVVGVHQISGEMDGSTTFVVAAQTAEWSGQLQDRTYAVVRILDGSAVGFSALDKQIVSDFISAGYIQ